MRPTTQRFSVLAGFTVLLFIVLANGYLTRRQLDIQFEKRQWMTHTTDVMLEISQIGSALKDAETGQRGFLYTSDPRYLTPYQAAVASVSAHQQKLQQLTSDNPGQKERVLQLNSLISTKLDELAQTISALQAGRPDEAKSLVLSDLGRNTMVRIRSILDEMWNVEAALNDQRVAEYLTSTRRTTWSIYLATTIAAFSIVTVGILVLLDLRSRERHAEEIRQRQEWFRITLNSIGDGVIATDPHGRVTFVNDVGRNIIGIVGTDVSGRDIYDIFPILNEHTNAPVENPVQKVIATGVVMGLANHSMLVRTDGTRVPIEDSASPIRNDRNQIIGVVLVFRDATHERHSQQILRRAEKLAAAGRLAATMAHEINNPLEAVANLLFIVQRSPELSAESKQFLITAEQQLERVSHITRQTLGFYRESTSRSEIQLPALIDSVLKLYDNKLRSKNILVEQDLDGTPSLSGMIGELRQLIANLVSNAIDAMEENGRLTISARQAAQNGHQGTEIQISDTGQGVAPEHAERIFEPFFTTKADVGTGLGLWVAREIAERHGGMLRLENTGQQNGSTFSIFLPSSTTQSESATA